jgi:hypothetical protein
MTAAKLTTIKKTAKIIDMTTNKKRGARERSDRDQRKREQAVICLPPFKKVVFVRSYHLKLHFNDAKHRDLITRVFKYPVIA